MISLLVLWTSPKTWFEHRRCSVLTFPLSRGAGLQHATEVAQLGEFFRSPLWESRLTFVQMMYIMLTCPKRAAKCYKDVDICDTPVSFSSIWCWKFLSSLATDLIDTFQNAKKLVIGFLEFRRRWRQEKLQCSKTASWFSARYISCFI